MIAAEKILFGDGPEFRVLNTQEMIQDNKNFAKISPYDNATALKCAESAAATPRRLDVIDKLNRAANPPKSWAKNLMEVGRPENIEAAYEMNDPSFFEGYVQDYPNLAITSNIRPTRSWLRRNPGRPICQPGVPEADG